MAFCRSCLLILILVAVVLSVVQWRVPSAYLYSLQNGGTSTANDHNNSRIRPHNDSIKLVTFPDTATFSEVPPRRHYLTNKTLASLRIVAFGTSKTRGSGVYRLRHIYVNRLSRVVHSALNLGIRGAQANYPSLCLYSMIGDEVFDVVILEFFPFLGEPHEHFERLVNRLRARFPEALIIYLYMPMPLNDVLYQGKYFSEYLMSQNLTSQQDPRFEAIVRNMSGDLVWDPEKSFATYNNTVQSAGGITVVFPEVYDNIEDHILKNVEYFGHSSDPWDVVHPNGLGHQLATEKILHELVKFVSRDDEPLTNNPSLPTAASEDPQDSCIYWMDHPEIAKNANATNMTLGHFGDPKKWVLEVDRAGGSMPADCSKLPICHIYLLYIAFGPRRVYPRVYVSVSDVENRTLVDPHLKRFHMSTTVHVGKVVNGTRVTLTVTPTTEDAYSTPTPFRISGIVTTPFYSRTLEVH